MVEKGDSSFEGNSHGHFINAHEEELGEAEIEISIGHPIERRFFPRFILKPLVCGFDRFPGGESF